MTETINLDSLTNIFESENDIVVEEDTRTCLYQDIATAVKNVLYVSQQITKRSRRKVVQCADLALAFEICGFSGALPFPTKSELDSTESSLYKSTKKKEEKKLDVVSIPASITPPLVETPIKEYSLFYDWVQSYENIQLQQTSSKIAHDKLIEYFSIAYKERGDRENRLFRMFLEKSPKVTAFIYDFLILICNETINILHDCPLLMSTYLYHLVRGIHSVSLNYTFNITIYDHLCLPTLFSVLCSKRICYEPTENHWSLRNIAANSLANLYIRNRSYEVKGSSFQMIEETLLDIIKKENTSVEAAYGCLHCIRLLGKEFVICFIETVFLPFLYQSKQYSEWVKEPMICEEMSYILNTYLSCNMNTEQQVIVQQELLKLNTSPEILFPKSMNTFGSWP